MIRPARPGDAAAVAAIYAPHVLTGTASFEIDAPDTAEMTRRMGAVTTAGGCWLVHDGGAVGGYAYATRFRDRPAYTQTCESAVYVAADRLRDGIGRALLTALAAAARDAGFAEMIAVIGDGAGNLASIRLHTACGFREAGRLTNVGNKFGRWLDIVYMQRSL